MREPRSVDAVPACYTSVEHDTAFKGTKPVKDYGAQRKTTYMLTVGCIVGSLLLSS